MKQSMRFPLLILAGGAGAFLLRLLQRSSGFEAESGLPIPGNLPALALIVWFLILAAACFLAARAWLPAEGEACPAPQPARRAQERRRGRKRFIACLTFEKR